MDTFILIQYYIHRRPRLLPRRRPPRHRAHPAGGPGASSPDEWIRLRAPLDFKRDASLGT
eukprot:378511-Pyramimonas_sp.AAC.1